MKSKNTKLLKTIAHEFRTPLNTINGILYSLDDNDLDTTINNKLKIIKQCSDHLNTIIHNINELFNDSIDYIDDIEPIIINKVLKKCKASYYYNINKNTIFISNSTSTKVYGNKKALTYTLNSIINNSITYTNNSTISISTKILNEDKNNLKVRFIIEDSKQNIDKAIRNELYSNLLITETKDSSTFNFNLFLLKKNIKACNGYIVAIPNKTNNSFIFDVTFSKQLKLNTSLNKPKNTLNNKFKILIAEDNKINQSLIKQLLEKNGYLCNVASNGIEAVDKAKQDEYDVILMDIMMPIMDGYEATTKIRKINPKIPIIALTTISEISNKDNFDYYINKPFDKEILFSIVEHYCLDG